MPKALHFVGFQGLSNFWACGVSIPLLYYGSNLTEKCTPLCVFWNLHLFQHSKKKSNQDRDIQRGCWSLAWYYQQCGIWVIHTCFVCMCVCAPYVHLLLAEVRRGCWSPWNWSYIQLWTDMWVLGANPGSSDRAESALSHWAQLLALFVYKVVHYFSTLNEWTYLSQMREVASIHPQLKEYDPLAGVGAENLALGLSPQLRQLALIFSICDSSHNRKGVNATKTLPTENSKMRLKSHEWDYWEG